MDSYISFRYLNKKLLDQYKGLMPVEIECSRRHYNGVDCDTYSYSTIVYYKKENFNSKNYANVKTFGNELTVIDFDNNFEDYMDFIKGCEFKLRDEIVDKPFGSYLFQANHHVVKDGKCLLVNTKDNKYDLDNFVMSVVEELNLLSESSRKKIISQYELIKYKLFKGEELSRKEYDLLSSLLDKDIDEKLGELTVLKLSL